MPSQIEQRLKLPLLKQPENEIGVFRLGLVLNGTVSAGAWTAGVLDALMEALDAWEAAKAAGKPVPSHRVRVEVLGGASGGGVCSAILARAATMTFPHGTHPSNPFWRVWGQALSLERMLGTGDLIGAGTKPASLLDGTAIDHAIADLLSWGLSGDPKVAPLATPRPWLANPLHVIMTLTNLRGIPYTIDFAPGEDGEPRRSWFTAHADHAIFAFPTAPDGVDTRDDVEVVSGDLAAPAWKRVGQFARATAAFPAGFPPVRLTRPTSHYDWRAVVAPAGGGRDPELRLLKPAWDQLPDTEQPGHDYSFFSVDGGALNNQPMELVRCGLAGVGNSLPRDALAAKAATVLIDPFAATPNLAAPDQSMSLLGVAGGTLSTLIQHARYATSDLLLATDATVASRFLLTPGRTNTAEKKVWGSDALTTSEGGAFIGFAFEEYRLHDYLLGRRNCLAWLAKHFRLPADNSVFQGFGADPAAAPYLDGGTSLPIIPLMPSLAALPPQPAWPMLDPDDNGFSGPFKSRFREVVAKIGALDHVPCGDGLAAGLIGGWARDRAMEAVKSAVQKVNARK